MVCIVRMWRLAWKRIELQLCSNASELVLWIQPIQIWYFQWGSRLWPVWPPEPVANWHVASVIDISACQLAEICNPNDTECESGNFTAVSQSSIDGHSTTETPAVRTDSPLDGVLRPPSVITMDSLNDTVVQSYQNSTASRSSLLQTNNSSTSVCYSSVVTMIREEDPSVAFGSASSLLRIFSDAKIFTARFDVDQFKDTGGTLSVTARLIQNKRVAVLICWVVMLALNLVKMTCDFPPHSDTPNLWTDLYLLDACLFVTLS